MTITSIDRCAGPAADSKAAAPATKALIWLAMVSSGFVFREPAPVDALMFGVIGVLMVFGPARFSPPVVRFSSIWLTISACGLLAVFFSPVPEDSLIHTVVSLYLAVGAIIVAAFVSEDPLRRTQLIYSGYSVAAIGTSILGIAGYFSLLPGAHDLFTLFDRAKGGFKDPNVLGAFLVPVILLGLDRLISASSFRSLLRWLLVIPLVSSAVLLSFSRGAWFNAAAAVAVWFAFSLITARSSSVRRRLGVGMAAGVLFLGVGAGIAIQFKSISNLAEQRVVAVQNYDNRRFDGQLQALEIITQSPLGIGARHFSLGWLHEEDVHNVYLSMFLNAGWLGGGLFLYLCFGTLAAGLRYGLRETPYQGLFLVTYASFAGVVVEGLVIDSDHWRHFYILMGLLWGMMANMNERQIDSTARSLPVSV